MQRSENENAFELVAVSIRNDHNEGAAVRGLLNGINAKSVLHVRSRSRARRSLPVGRMCPRALWSKTRTR